MNETSLGTLRKDMSDKLINDLKLARDAESHRASLICANHASAIQKILNKYGNKMYGVINLSFFDFRGGYNSLARDILISAGIT